MSFYCVALVESYLFLGLRPLIVIAGLDSLLFVAVDDILAFGHDAMGVVWVLWDASE